MNQPKILVVDDDKEIVGAIKKRLEMEDYEIITAYDGLEAMDILMEQEVQLLIIDVMMPKMDGLSATMKIRESKNIPIIILSAKTEESDKILGLSMGADDYISKPFRPDELVARVKSQLRRYMQFGGMNAAESNKEQIINGGLILDMKGKRMMVDGEPVKLTATEYKIVSLLMNNLGRVFSADEIYERVWNEEAYATENTVMVHIRRIREKIEIDAKNPRYLKVVWGGIYGLDTINNMAVTGDNSFSLDEQDQSDYIKNTQMSLFDKWADQEGDKVYYTQANHVSESLLNKIKKESFVKVTMKVKPYDKKMVTTTSTYGTENANYTGGRIEHFHIERGKTEKLNKDGSFKGWDTYDEYDEYNSQEIIIHCEIYSQNSF